MSQTTGSGALPIREAHQLIDQATKTYAEFPAITGELQQIREQLDEPLRIALAGPLKAGKSTLLNSLVGENIAPTDVLECTKIVTTFEYGHSPKVIAHGADGSADNLRVGRHARRLELDLGQLDAEHVERLAVSWPAAALKQHTYIDTPGTASISAEVSERTRDFLAPEHGRSGADVVLYLMRSLRPEDVELLKFLHQHAEHDGTSLGVIIVLSRADEIGSGRIDAMLSAEQAADKLRNEEAIDGLFEAIVPVAGLLALAGAGLRQSQFATLGQLESLPREWINGLLVSIERFTQADDETLPSQADRVELVETFGVFGIRMAIAMIRSGIRDAAGLSEELMYRSGLSELRRVLDVHFAYRHPQFKTHSAVRALRRLVLTQPLPQSQPLLESLDDFLSDGHAFTESQLLGKVRAKQVPLTSSQVTELERLIGGRGTSAQERLGLADEQIAQGALHDAAVEELWRWRDRADNPLLDTDAIEACRIAAMSCESILDELRRVEA